MEISVILLPAINGSNSVSSNVLCWIVNLVHFGILLLFFLMCCKQDRRQTQQQPDTKKMQATCVSRFCDADATYRTLVEHSPVIMYLQNIAGSKNVTYVSPQIEQIIGIPRTDFLGDRHTFFSRIHQDDRDRVREIVDRSLESHIPYTVSYRIRRTDNTFIWLREQTTIITDENGKPHAVHGMLVKVTDDEPLAHVRILGEKHLQRMLDTSLEGVLILDEHARMLYVNKRFLEMLQYDEFDVLHRPYYAFIHPDERYKILKYIRRRRRGFADQYELRFCRRDGSDLWTIIATSPIFDEVGAFAGSIGMITDVTEYTRSREALQRSQARFHAIIERAPLGVVLLKGDALTIIEVNARFEQQLGYSMHEVQRLDILAIIHPEDRKHMELICEQLSGQQVTENQCITRFLRKSGEELWTQFTLGILDNGINPVELIIGLITDISEAKLRENESIKYRQQLRALASELSRVEERERRQLASALHDSVCQTLAFANIKLGLLAKALETPEAKSAIVEIRDSIEQSVEQARALTFELSPPILYEIGFLSAISWLAEDFEHHYGLSVNIKTNIQQLSIDMELRGLLYRSVRELLINVVKHAHAHHATVIIDQDASFIYISVVDDGNGIPITRANEEKRQHSGFGLFHIRERLEILNGSLKIISNPGQGLDVRMILPHSCQEVLPQDEES